MSIAFFITARTEPVKPGPDKFGSGTRVILYDATSQEAAEQWAKVYVEHLLLDDHPEQELAKLEVIPVYERLLTSAGDERIDWHSFVMSTNATDRQDDPERGSSMRFTPANAHKPVVSANAANNLEYIKRHIPNAERFNWNPKKQSYYVLHHGRRAYIVQAMNMFLASQPYVRAFTGTPDGDCAISIATFPGTKPYRE